MTLHYRPFSLFAAMRYAVRAAIAHFRFARAWPDPADMPEGVSLVVSTRDTTADELTTLGTRWSDFSRQRGAQPVDPAIIWRDMALMWNALHRNKGELLMLIVSEVSDDEKRAFNAQRMDHKREAQKIAAGAGL